MILATPETQNLTLQISNPILITHETYRSPSYLFSNIIIVYLRTQTNGTAEE